MSPIASYLPIWKEKLNKSKKAISKQLENAKSNGGRTGELRARLKQELSIAKKLKKAIKQIEGEVGKIFDCPCCACKLTLSIDENGEQSITLVKEKDQKT